MSCGESKLEHNTARYFTPPIKERITFEEGDDCKERLDRLFDPDTSEYAKTPFEFYSFNEKKYLALP